MTSNTMLNARLNHYVHHRVTLSIPIERKSYLAVLAPLTLEEGLALWNNPKIVSQLEQYGVPIDATFTHNGTEVVVTWSGEYTVDVTVT